MKSRDDEGKYYNRAGSLFSKPCGPWFNLLYLLLIQAMVIGWAFIFTADVFADAPKPLSLSDALGIASANSPVVKQAQATHRGAQAGIRKARSAFLPRIDLEESFSRTNSPVMVFSNKLGQERFTQQDFALNSLNDPNPLSNWQTRLVLTQPLFNQGREYLGYKMSRVGEEVAGLAVSKSRQAVFFSVEKAFYQAILAEDALKVMEKAVETARANEALAEKRYEAGLALKSDVLAARVHKADAERRRLKAEGDAQVAMAALNRAMGIDQDRAWELLGPKTLPNPMESGLDYWLGLARKNRPEMRIVDRQVRLAELRKKAALFHYMPSLNLKGWYESNTEHLVNADGDSWTIMATASINLFNGLGDKATVSQATADVLRARERKRDVEAGIELEVRQAFYRLVTARKQLDVTLRSVAQAEEALRLLKKRYENGLALMVELLGADTSLREARLEVARARFNTRLAASELKWRSGTLERDRHLEQ